MAERSQKVKVSLSGRYRGEGGRERNSLYTLSFYIFYLLVLYILDPSKTRINTELLKAIGGRLGKIGGRLGKIGGRLGSQSVDV